MAKNKMVIAFEPDPMLADLIKKEKAATGFSYKDIVRISVREHYGIEKGHGALKNRKTADNPNQEQPAARCG